MLATEGPEALADADGTGLEVSQRFFEEADALVVTSEDYEAQRTGAQEAIDRHAPMLLATGENTDAITGEADRLGASTVVTVGDVPSLGGEDASFEIEEVAAEESVDPAQDETAEQVGEDGADAGAEEPVDQGTTVDLETAPQNEDNEDPDPRAQTTTEIAGMEPSEDHPVALPPIFVTEQSSPASVATAKAAGGEVHLLEYPDPRITSESMEIASSGDTIALGQQFGDSERYEAAVDMADNGELPGGGGLVFPGRRMIALYGHPSGDALGVMGEQPPAEAVERVESHIENYQPLEEQPVIPAFEIIVTVASSQPGADGKYSNTFPVEDYIGYVDAITDAGGYAVLDLQPGRASFLEQAQMFEELLKRPNVGLALDPEWKIGPDELPMQRIGHVEAAEVNEVADWLAELTRENDLPQKALVLHQFQSQMIRDRDQIDTSHPELAFVLHADGHGTPDLKFETWNVLQEGLDGEWFMAWKNFIDEDTPTFTPEQTYNWVDPRPWFVSYQ
ncbi:cell wall-binding repeat 2 family protein [Corynebacterium yudongzhengii]|uniref:Cell wall-binding repeat 2 family protein n=1 Tax=Corynebacterium yudongzhengii TaxID=2080740 RepID=A0A2U1T9J2_9CORY|nr:cell wall-binding repeat 2 family protein [Corynebacterium yudongzhengii]AWB82989.1 cell wall-binding repeat 2 family protein [Corynebacterium yudongzhengii]PWC02671.1 cell wall-binding repeat 2 family protein [Corynebacterium yudongzhengii]